MDRLLTPVSTRQSLQKSEPLLFEQGVEKPAETAKPRHPFKFTSPEEALESLKNEPDYDTLAAVLRYMASGEQGFDIRSPSPLSAQIVQVLVTSIVPNYWVLLKEDSDSEETARKSKRITDLGCLIQCLRSISGLSATITRLRALISEANSDGERHQDVHLNLDIILELLRTLLDGRDSLRALYSASIKSIKDEPKRRPMTQELLNMIGSGRVVSLASEAQTIINKRPKAAQSSWIADGKAYTAWLASNIVQWTLQASSPEDAALCVGLLRKSLGLGYAGMLQPAP